MRRVAAATSGTSRFRTNHVIRISALVLVGIIGAGAASAQNAPTFRITRSITAQATATDNVDLAPDDRKRSGLIYQISPAFGVSSTGGGRVRYTVSYRAQGLGYSNESSYNDVQNYLDATANVEAVENWLFIDANAAITQQAISPFGPQPILNNENRNTNRAETYTYRISPYIRGIVASAADYELRYSRAATRASGTQAGDSSVEEWALNLRGLRPIIARLGWELYANDLTVHPDVGRDITSRRVRGSLIYEVDPQIRTTALVGYETSNFSSPLGRDESDVTYGGIVEWTPTPRTRLRGLYEKRVFGDTHEFVFEHRTRLTSWQYTDTRALTSLPEQLALGRTSTAFNLFFDALTTRIPDPVQRAQEVQRILRQTGIPADLAVSPLFLTSRATVQRARQASVGFLGLRNTVTLAVGVTDTEAADSASPFVDDFSRFSDVKQRHATASWALRVTPFSTINLTGSHIRSTSESAQDAESKQTSAYLLFSHQLGRRTTGTLGVRYVHFDSNTASDYKEKAATASLLITFD
jgi:uncharacterized protein (PEP-CTERM system associated)